MRCHLIYIYTYVGEKQSLLQFMAFSSNGKHSEGMEVEP